MADFGGAEAASGLITLRYGLVLNLECEGETDIEVAVCASEPPLEASAWQRVVTGSVEVLSGTLRLSDCIDVFHREITLPKGMWQVRMLSTGLDTLADPFHGEDRYRVELWPGPARAHAVVVPY